MTLLIRRVLLLAALLAACLVVGSSRQHVTSGSAGDGIPSRLTHETLIGAGTIIKTLARWAAENPDAAGVTFALVTLLLGIPRVIALLPRRIERDPQRAFSAEQRRAGFLRCGGRCEAETLLLGRCRRPAVHGDHWYPHSKGGRTSMRNFAGLCQWHNLSKSSHTPTWWETTRLEWRRRRYFPQGVERRPSAR